jgi:tetraacyldisaccharide-1-P 4'-kinase
MDLVKQAFSISDKKKAHALRLYKEAVSVLVRKEYKPMDDDVHVDLSAIFGMKYVEEILRSGQRDIGLEVYAASNVEFNYANCRHSKKEQFISLAKQLVPDHERVNDEKLENFASQMNCILTFTTAKGAEREFVLFT